MDLKKISLGKIDTGRLFSGILSFFEKNIQLFFFLGLLGVISYSGFIWYKFVYNAEWNETEKQEYMKSKEKGAIFNKSAFENIVFEKERRKAESEKSVEGIADIFQLDSNQASQ